MPVAIELTLRESFQWNKNSTAQNSCGYDIMPQIMEHATSQSPMIQNPRLPVREGQPCLSSFNRGAWNSWITTMAKQSSLFLSLWLGAISLYEGALLSSQNSLHTVFQIHLPLFSTCGFSHPNPSKSRNSLAFFHCLARAYNSVESQFKYLLLINLPLGHSNPQEVLPLLT